MSFFLLAAAGTLPAHAADPNKVLRVAFEIEETGFDPVKVTDEYSNRVIEQTNEALLGYDYLARPARLAPLTAESLPEVTDNGKTYLFHLKKGILFHPDPAFKGKKRELNRRGLCLLDQAPDGPEESVAVALRRGRQDRRPR